ncbi:hypothetical protein JW921_09400, partial [Candidatus Fermentibacterales bacterium]|nr:hypothetical protein [Candidatus Fermentibacterales bacterium]
DLMLDEIHRVCSRWALISVPDALPWRLGNLLMLRYVGTLGNPPAHLNEWTGRGFGRFVSRLFDISGSRQPLPWTMLLLERATPRSRR